MKTFLKETIPYLVILAVIVIVRLFIVTPVEVSGSSMYDTLLDTDIVLLQKIGSLERNDIVVVSYKNERLIKRLAALPGDTISCVEGVIYVNGEVYTYGTGVSFDFDAVTLKEDEYYVLGDNHNNSMDSRYIGPVSRSQIQGKTTLILYPFSRFGSIGA